MRDFGFLFKYIDTRAGETFARLAISFSVGGISVLIVRLLYRLSNYIIPKKEGDVKSNRKKK